MKIGTRSVLFGAHQFLLHPLFVAVAWWRLYGFPWDPRLWVAFFVHDLGYLGKPNMDGPEGEEHPRLGAVIMGWLFDRAKYVYEERWQAKDGAVIRSELSSQNPHAFGSPLIGLLEKGLASQLNKDNWTLVSKTVSRGYWHDFTLYHSRFMARRNKAQFSRLCVADKLATVLMPDGLYLFLVNLTGEIHEYMDVASHKEGAKYGNEKKDLSNPRAWRASMCDYILRWVVEHEDCRPDTWTPGGEVDIAYHRDIEAIKAKYGETPFSRTMESEVRE